MNKENTNMQKLFSNIEEQLFELGYSFYEENENLSKKLNHFVVLESKAVIDYIRSPWDTFNEGVMNRFEKLNQPNLSSNERQTYLKEALEFVAPKNLVQVADQLFNLSHLEEIKRRYDKAFDYFQKNEFASLIGRYRVPNEIFTTLFMAIMEESKGLTDPVQRLSKSYMELLETLKEIQKDDDEELFIFGAGLLASALAGPIGGMATRNFLRSSNSKGARINKVIEKIYRSLENLYNEIEASLIHVQKKVVFMYYTIYLGLIDRLGKDINHHGYEINDVDFKKKEFKFTLVEQEKKKLRTWYISVQKEIVEHLTKENYKEADVISKHVFRFFVNNPFAQKIGFKDYPLGFHAAILRYSVLTNWLQRVTDLNFSEQNKSKLMNGYSYYSKFFNDLNLGINGIESIDSINVPTILETVVHYIHLTERLVTLSPENAFQLRTNTLNSLMEYLINFSEKQVGEDSIAFKNEFIDKSTLELIAGYQIFLKSINITTVTSQILKRTIPIVSFKSLLQHYELYIPEGSRSESYFHKFLLSQKQIGNGSNSRNSDLLIDKREKLVMEEAASEEDSITVLRLFGTLEFQERVYKGEWKDTEEDYKKWQQIWGEKLDFLERLLHAKQGNSKSQYILGGMYTTGTGVEVNEQEAFHWFLKAAKQNYTPALEIVPNLYWKGQGVEKNPTEAYKWMKKLVSALKKPEDQLIFGSMYLEGYGTTVNYQKAYEWFMRGASQGNTDAQYEIGKMVEKGQHVSGNLQEAKKWYREAAEQGHSEAKTRLEELEKAEQKARYINFTKIVVPIVTIGLISYLLVMKVYLPKTNYEKANELLLVEKYNEAIPILKELQDYKDSPVLLENAEDHARYLEAIEAFNDGSYKSAMDSFWNMLDFKDSRELYFEAKYMYAKEFLEERYFEEAIDLFGELVDYKDSNELIKIAQEEIYKNAITKINNREYNEARKSLFKVLNYRDARKRLHGLNNLIATDIGPVTNSKSNTFTLTLKEDGTVIGEGHNYQGQLRVDHWEDIVQVAAGLEHSVGLRANGTVRAVGYDGYGQLDVGIWEDIVEIAAGSDHTVGLTADGEVEITGDDIHVLQDIWKWYDIVAIAAIGDLTIGLKADGTVLVAGSDSKDNSIDLSNWKDIVDISVNTNQITGLQADGARETYDLK